MRIWHEDLIPKLCQKHLCAMWREGLGMYKIITENKKAYRNHPATREFENCPTELFKRLARVRQEAHKRGYHFKDLPELVEGLDKGKIKEWQTIEEQIEILKNKKCQCKL